MVDLVLGRTCGSPIRHGSSRPLLWLHLRYDCWVFGYSSDHRLGVGGMRRRVRQGVFSRSEWAVAAVTTIPSRLITG